MLLRSDGRQGTGNSALDTDLRDLDLLNLPGGWVLLAMTGGNGGLASYAVGQAGGLRLQDTQRFPARFATPATGEMDIVTLDGDRVVLFGGDSAGLAGYGVGDSGDLGRLVQASGPGEVPASLISLQPHGLPFAYLVEAGTGQVAGYRIAGDGTITPLPGTGLTLDPSAVLQAAEIGGTPILLAADRGRQGVASYVIDPASGALQTADTVGMIDGLGINTPTALQVVDAHGETFVILAAAGSNSLSVIRLDAGGAMEPTDHILDTRTTRFGGVQALEVITAGDQVLVLAGGADDGLSLFTLLPGGQLLHLQSIAHTGADGLEDITDIAAAQIGGTIRVFTGSEADGIGQLSIPLDDLGHVLLAGSAAATRVKGSSQDDQLVAQGAGPDTLTGGAGDDILVSSWAGTVMEGGAGADTFVIRPSGSAHRITDFNPAEDRIDLGSLPMLRALSQLSATPESGGARLTYRGTEVSVQSHDGSQLDAPALFGSELTGPDRVLVLAWGPTGTRIAGTDRADQLSGSAGGDTLTGGAGPDKLLGGEGDDLLLGGDGNDLLDAGLGDDEVWAGAHGDTILGGAGNDTLGGGPGDDQIWGGFGNDILYASDGADTVGGGSGDDELWAGTGDDVIYASDGDDRIGGGLGNDEIWSGTGNDSGYGSDGTDRLGGGPGDDDLWGGEGDDALYGGNGDDTLGGGDQADDLWGGDGNDRLLGGTGDDTLGGGPGDDMLIGDGGADVFLFAPGSGADRIADFVPGTDVIRLAGTGLGFTGLAIADTAEGALVDIGGDTILLETVPAPRLSAADFDFV